ncbi:MAG TPA: TRAP transporter substrate-binding protein DctP [Polyangiales bacterium]|nr:TRAP transporter substrate-binding protein DctP [Polyangiales bacterium]
MRKSAIAVLLGACLLAVVPGSAFTAAEQIVLKVAVPIPRTQEVAIEAKKYNDKLAALTNNSVQVKIYWGGAAGDDVDVLRKMRAGQMDGAPLSLELVSQFVRQALVLASPALFNNYKQVDAVRAAMTPAMDKEAYDNGFKVMAWADIGRLRLLSKKPIENLADLKKMRPWLYPQSEMLKEFYRGIGATGVPLGIAEVYGGLQTSMIDVVWGSALLSAALQWHSGTQYISETGLGFISGAFVFRRAAWDGLPKNVQDNMLQLTAERARENQIDLRKQDEKAFQKLVARGHIPLKAKNPKEWWDAGKALRGRMVGRVYTKDLVEKAEQISLKYAEAPEEIAAAKH